MKIKIAAVIVSAGLSSRMGRFKPLLTFGVCTAVELVIQAFLSSGVDPTIVVGGHRFSELENVVAETNAKCTYNPNYRQGMFSSFKHGFRALPSDIHAFFAHPVDIPLISPQIVKRMRKAFVNHPDAIVYPRYKGKPGRPVLIPCDLLGEILASDDKGGLRIVLKAHSNRFRFVEVNHPAILLDMDNKDDYQKLRELYYNEPIEFIWREGSSGF